MPKLQEYNAKGKPRNPPNFIQVSDKHWERLKLKGNRWREVKEPVLKKEVLTEIKIKTKKKKV
jgi:hypothetical protein